MSGKFFGRRYFLYRGQLRRHATPRHFVGVNLRRLHVEQLEDRRMLSVDASILEWLQNLDTPLTNPNQLFVLDTDGANGVTYDGPIVVSDINVPPFSAGPFGLVGQDDEIIRQVLNILNEDFLGSGISFARERPVNTEPFSTVYLGGSDGAFSEYGWFLGLAENIDTGNSNPLDEAFVFSDNLAHWIGTATIDELAAHLSEVIAHESAHLLGWSHPGDDEATSDLSHLALSAPTLTSPANGATGQSTTPTFTWSSVAGANTYRILVATSASALPTGSADPVSSPSLKINTTTSSTSYMPSAGVLAEGVTYYWEVRAGNNVTGAGGFWSSQRNFATVAAGIPTPTGLTATPTSPTSIIIQWDDVISAGNYFLQRSNISPTSGFTQIAILPQDDTSYTDDNSVVDHINPGTTYYYRVRAKIGGSFSGYSTVASTTTPHVVTLPDLVIQQSDVILIPEGSSQRVVVTVHNIAAGAATNIRVRFRDLETNTDIANETIAFLAPGTSAIVSTLWAPIATGTLISVTIDPFDLIVESSNSNNSAWAVYGAASAPPVVTKVVAEWDGDANPLGFGRFISDVDLLNAFTASILDPDGDSDIDHVVFTLGSLGTLTDVSAVNGWSAAFNVGQLIGDTVLMVTAYDDEGLASDIWTGIVHVVPFPAAMGERNGDDYFDAGHYHLTDLRLGLPVWHTIDPDWWFIGGTETGFRLGFEVNLLADLHPELDVAVDVAAVLEAKIFDGIVNLPGDGDRLRLNPLKLDLWGNFNIGRPSVVLDRDSLLFSSFAFDLSMDSFSLSGYLKYLVETGKLSRNPLSFEKSLPPLPPIIPFVPTRSSFGINADVTISARARIGWNANEHTLQFLDNTFVEAAVSLEPFGSIGVGVDLLYTALEVGTEFGGHYRAEYDSVNGFEQFAWGSFQVNFRLVAAAGKKHTLVTWIIPGEGQDPWIIGNPPPGSGTGSGTGSGAAIDPDIWSWPNMSSDDSGNVLFTRILDLDENSGEIDPEVFYAVRNTAGEWSPLDAVALNDLIESDPDAAFDGNGGAVAVWVANTIDPADVEATPWEVYLTTQEIYSAYWNGIAWTTPQVVTSDSMSDGGPEVAFHAGNGLMLWEHAGGAIATDLGGFEIMYALWDDVTKTWGPPLALTADMNGDWAPTLAFDRNGNAIAVWVHDDDGDPTTTALRYSVWDGSSWSIVGDVPSTPGVAIREPRVAFDSSGNALLAWIANEGAEDILHTSVWDSTADAWSSPQPIDSTPPIVEGLDLAIGPNDEAMLVWHGWDGQHDLFSTIRESGTEGPWTPPTRLTDTVEGEWMASTTFDSTGQPVMVWANETTTTVFGEGADGIELTLVPDLVAQTLNLDSASLTEGESTRLTLTVSNLGWQPSTEAEVRYYLGDPDLGGTQLGSTSYVGALDPSVSMLVFSEPFSLPSGSLEYFAVITPTPAELNSSNNAASLSVEVAPLDAAGPHVSLINTTRGEAVTLGTRMLTLLFSEPVGNATAEQFTLIEDTLGFVTLDHIYQAADGRSFYLVVEGGLPVVGSNGSYTLQVLPSVIDIAGNPLNDGVPEIFTFDVVDLPGDYNFDGDVDEEDYSEWKANYGETMDSIADGNRDGTVDAADYTVWRNNLGATLFPPQPPELLGDYNEDRSVDAADYTVWRNTLGTEVIRFSGADGDGNGIVQTADYDVWRANYGNTFFPPQPPELLGDYNEDGSVDAADYTVWRNSLGSFVTTRYSGADGDGNGIIQPADYDIWKANYGNISPPESTAIPAMKVRDEPAATIEHADSVLNLDKLPNPPNTNQHVLPLDGFNVVTSTSLSLAPSRPLRQVPELKALSPQKDLLAIWLDSSACTRHIAANSEEYFGLRSADERDNFLFEAVDQAFDDFGAEFDRLLHL